jgi:UDP-N-acetylmuramoyl-L-alanyl-D-glutamate--2,6-diaminopimelate ligase
MQQKLLTFSSKGNDATIKLETIESFSWGNKYTIQIPEANKTIELIDKLPGAYNCANVMASLLAVSGLLKLPVENITPFVEELTPVRGRMTTIEKGQSFEVVVDFAHTPSSFEAIYPPLYDRIKKNGGRIISLFGSAGERDIQKRFDQGKIAATYSDIVVLADEDPRSEDPMSILEEIANGCKAAQNGGNFVLNENLFLIPDRPLAIRKALSLAFKNDLVIFLGKGHENSIIYANHSIPFDEITEVEKSLEELLSQN